MVWPKSTETTGQGNTYHTEKIKISLALPDTLASMHILVLNRGESYQIHNGSKQLMAFLAFVLKFLSVLRVLLWLRIKKLLIVVPFAFN